MTLSVSADLLERMQALHELLPPLTSTLDVREVFDRLSAVSQKIIPHDMLRLITLTDDLRMATFG